MDNTINKKKPKECQSIQDVRDEIDTLDREILKLLGERFKYVKQVVNFKEKNKDSIVASKRRDTVIAQRREWAIENGISPDAIEEMYRNLIKYFIAEEMKIIEI